MITPHTELCPGAVAAHYDNLDRFYRELWGEHVHHGLWRTGRESPAEAVVRLIDLVAERGAIEPGDRVCDVGCGYGGTARVLASQYGAEVTALTITPSQHAYAVGLDHSSANPTYLLRDWAENGLPSGHFDVVLSIESSEHMANKTTFLAEVYRVLKPGGRFVVCAWLATPKPRPWEVRHLLEPICREGRLPGLGSAEEYDHLVRDAGLTPIAFEDLSQNVKRTWLVCAGRVLKAFLRQPEYRRFLFESGNPDRIFALTLLRIWIAYETGSMGYGILSAVKPAECAIESRIS
jgi:tocopherol O-methyltransferase